MKFKVTFSETSTGKERKEFYMSARLCGYIRKPRVLDGWTAAFQAKGEHPKPRKMAQAIVVTKLFGVIKSWEVNV